MISTLLSLFLWLGALLTAPPLPESIHYELISGGERVGTFAVTISEASEGMLVFEFRGTIGESGTRGELRAAPRLLHRYARLAVEAESGSDFLSNTLFAAPAVRLIEAVRSGRSPKGYRDVGAAHIAGVAGRAFAPRDDSATGPDLIVASPDLHLPLRVRTRQDPETVIEVVATAVRRD